MAVAPRGFAQLTSQADGVTVSWPTGTVAGDLALAIANDSDGPGAGWTRWAQELWSKTLTAADLAGNLTIPGTLTGLTVFSAARGIGQVRERRGRAGLTLAEANSGIFVHGWTSHYATTLDPPTNKLGVNVSHNRGRNTEAVWARMSARAGWLELVGVTSDATYVAYELLPAKVPAAPVVTAPSGYVVSDTDIAVSWVPDGRQDAYRVEITNLGTSAVVYLLADGTVTATPTSVNSSTPSASVDTGQLALGIYRVQVATENEAGLGDYSAGVSFVVAARPTVDSVTVTSPAGELNPAVAYTATAGTGTITAVQVRITAAGATTPNAPIWDSYVRAAGTVTADSLDADGLLLWTNGTNQLAWVRVRDQELWSAWTKDDATFAVTWTNPTAPSALTVTDGAPITAAMTVPATSELLEVQVSSDDGATWVAVASIVNPATSQSVPLPLTAYNATIKVRARSWQTVDGVQVPSAWAPSAGVKCTDLGAYLVDDTNRSEYLAVQVVEDAARKLVQGVGVSYGLGATAAMVDRTPTMGESGATRFRTQTDTARAALVTWLSARDKFWIRWNPERLESHTDAPATLVAVASPVEWERLVQVDVSHRHVKVSWVSQ